MSDFIGDYKTYMSRYESPQNYAYFVALGLLGAVVNRRVVFLHGDIEIHGNLYILIVGPQGNGKSVPNDIASALFHEVCPNLAIGASTQSAEQIVETMAKEDFPIDFCETTAGDRIITKPYAFFINEFKDFIAYAPTRMLNFLGNIYDRKSFKSGTIKRGVEDIMNPSLNIIACENPEQLVGFMKNNVMSGGLSRRFIIVNEINYGEPKAFIEKDDLMREKLLARLRAARSVTGTFQWAESGRKFYQPWYDEKQRSLPTILNQIMRGYISTKHVQLFKICMLLDAVSDKPMLLFTDELMQLGLSFLDIIEPNMPLLSESAGRNDLIGPQRTILETIKRAGGAVQETALMRLIQIDLKPWELLQMFEHLERTEQIVKKQLPVPNSEGKKIDRWFIFLPEALEKFVKEGKIKITNI